MASAYEYHTVVVAPIALMVLAWLTVLTRVYVKKVVVNSFCLDDLFMILSVMVFTAFCGLILVAAGHGLGKHEVDLLNSDRVLLYKDWFYCNILYILATVNVKISITLLLQKPSSKESHRIAYWIITLTGIFYTVCGLIGIIVVTTQCNPVAKYWDRSLEGQCIGRDVFAGLVYSYSAISSITDVVLAVVPIWLVWNLRLDRKTKISVSVVLGLGVSTVIVNIARFWFIDTLSLTTDSSYRIVPITLLSVLEVGLGIIAASLATFRPLLRRISKFLSSYTSPIVSSASYSSQQKALKEEQNAKVASSRDVEIGVPKPFEEVRTKDEDSKEWNRMLAAITARRNSFPRALSPSATSNHTHASPHTRQSPQFQNDFQGFDFQLTTPGAHGGDEQERQHHISEDIPLPSFISHEGEVEEEYDEYDDLQRMSLFAEDFARWNRKESIRSVHSMKPRKDSEVLWEKS